MRFRWLALFPLLYAAGFAALAWALLGSDSLTPFVRGQLILVRVLALAGCLAAVSAFERGDHLRRAWLALAAATLLVLVRDILRLPPFEMPSGTLIVGLLGVSSNLALLAGVWLLAHSWRVAAIEPPERPPPSPSAWPARRPGGSSRRSWPAMARPSSSWSRRWSTSSRSACSRRCC